MNIASVDNLLAWLHVSDIHMGHGDAAQGWDQRLVLQGLQDDLTGLMRGGKVRRPELILVTGDIAFSGASRSSTEYEEAHKWLLSVAGVANLTDQ